MKRYERCGRTSDRNDGMYQPFLTTGTVGGELRPEQNPRRGGNGILNSAMEFPLTLSDPNERTPYTFKYLDFMADRHMQYSHVVPNVNLFTVGKDKIMSRLAMISRIGHRILLHS
ncbi:unnamed protein product [Heligmosomoides polygyrus]|uniref:Tyrosine-protein phosphatase domain-containing protein n=1 Tax=Heligmosomoides polygyrus TaxID=6339 RepID=A0A183GTJ3_HELPZ|nr:unnamed protein product [Heligmosomoides polygyrus]